MITMGSETSTTPQELRHFKIQIKKESEKLADSLREYMRALGVLGIAQPIPPRPKPDPEIGVVGRLLYATVLIEEAMTKLDSVIDA